MVAALRDNEDLFASQPSIFTFSFTGLDPDGCLVADRIRIRTNKFENPDAGYDKGLISYWMMSLQKKRHHFLRWRGVFS